MTAFRNNTALQIRRFELPTPFPVGPVNAYLVRWADHAVLVDCGPATDEARKKLVQMLEGEGLCLRDLSGLILTHGHVDHVGNAGWMREFGIPVYAPEFVDTWLEPGGKWDLYRQDFFVNLYNTQGVPNDTKKYALSDLEALQRVQGASKVDMVLEYNKPCPLLPQFEVLHVPGHAQHALALWNPESGDLIVGDQLLPHISSNALVEPQLGAQSGALAKRTKSLLQYRENLKFLQSLDIRTVYPGHGAVFTEGIPLIDTRLSAQEKRMEEFLERVKSAPGRPAHAIAVEYFPRHTRQTSLIMSETLGYLDWLSALGAVEERREDGVSHWWSRL